VFVNAVGAQDELIFDGHSLVLDEEGQIVARAPAFEEALLVVDVDATTAVSRRLRDARRRALARARRELPNPPVVDVPEHAASGTVAPVLAPALDELEQMRRALELGLGDYMAKNGFHDVVLGISGGIDSALTAALAAETLGPERVHCVSMPSRYSSGETRADAKRVAESIGAQYIEIPIEPQARRSPPRSRARSPAWPRRTSRPGSAASS
jgi:NAD+ synthase (glutamine-hydrolysing)